MNIEHAHFLGKQELFDGALGNWFRELGGIPVDRFGEKGEKEGVVDKAISLFNKHDKFILAISLKEHVKKWMS